MPMQIRGTAAPNSPPTGLAERQLSVEMGSSPPKLWCGVSASIDPVNGRIQLSPPIDYVSQSQLAAYLPLAGGTLNDGASLTLNPVNITNTGLVVNATGQVSTGIRIQAGHASSTPNALVINLPSVRGMGIDINNSGSSDSSLRIRNAGTDHFNVAANGTVAVGAPTGPVVTGAGNVNISGQYLVNGVSPAGGISEPSTAGNFLRTDTGTWVEGLPLAGGELATINGAGGVGLKIVNDGFNAYALDITNEGFGTRAIYVENDSLIGVEIYTKSGTGAQFAADAGATALGTSGQGNGVEITQSGAGLALEINNTGTGNSLLIRNGATNHFIIASDSTVTMSAAFAASMRTALGI